MKRRFSDHELYVLRNDVRIDILIETKLNIPNKIREGFFRFLCPRCGEFNTATNPETNLARCFSCNKNFNTIDMVMAARKLNFVKSVQLLKEFHEQSSSKAKATTQLESETAIQFNMDRKTDHRGKCVKPMALGEVFKDMTEQANFHGPMESNTPLFNQKGQVMIRLEKLENELKRLCRQIEQIHTFLKLQNR
ncbi:MAG: DNA primase [Chloroflexi bacterium]|nr:DNA primase [Chloroflexota bacterium]